MKQESTTRFVLHTRLAPAEMATEKREEKSAWQVLRHPYGKNLTPGEKLLRNSAIACMALLAFLALGRVDEPWADEMTGGIEEAFTTQIDLDESLWSLAFMGDLLPESVQAFFGMDGEAIVWPADGEILHPWTEEESWTAIACGSGGEVRAALDGTVTAVAALSGGGYGVLIDHGQGVETVYVQLDTSAFDPGDAVKRGQVIGSASEEGVLYFELRQGSESVDPEGGA